LALTTSTENFFSTSRWKKVEKQVAWTTTTPRKGCTVNCMVYSLQKGWRTYMHCPSCASSNEQALSNRFAHVQSTYA